MPYLPGKLPGQSDPLPIPDLRYERSFIKKLKTNALKQYKSTHKGETIDSSVQAPITTSVIISTIIRDQLFMPLVQGFFMTAARMIIIPWLRSTIKLGKRATSAVSAYIKASTPLYDPSLY